MVVAVVVAGAVVVAVAVRAAKAAHFAIGLEAVEILWCSEPSHEGEHRARSPPARAATTTS